MKKPHLHSVIITHVEHLVVVVDSVRVSLSQPTVGLIEKLSTEIRLTNKRIQIAVALTSFSLW